MSARRVVALLVLLIALLAAAAPAAAAAAPETPSPTPPHVVVPWVTLTVPSGLWLGDTATLTVTVKPPVPGAAVAVESGRAGEWSTEATATLDGASRALIAWTPAHYGRVDLRVTLPAGAGYTAAISATHRVIVNRPNPHHVLYRNPHYIVIVVHQYRLYYYEHGRLVRAFDVALGRPGYRTPLGTFRIFGKRRPAGGALGACAMFYRREGGIAIHGTDQPGLLRRFPRPFSHGCARMYNSQALWLYERVPKGTTVHNIR